MKLPFLKKYILKKLAKHLRKPSGKMGLQVGENMNVANRFLYQFTIDNMQLKDNEKLLEIGFGNGLFFDTLFATANQLQVAGLDFSDTMVKAATIKNQQAIANKNLVLKHGSSHHIDFESNHFDKVFCINVVYFWDNPAAHLKEILRVLQPGGTFYATIRTKDTMQNLPFTQYGFLLYNQKDLENLFHSNGFVLKQTVAVAEPDIMLKQAHYTAQSICVSGTKPIVA